MPLSEHPHQRHDRHRRFGNDRPLLRDAGLPLAMGNAIADVKDAARYVMPDCDHDGVAEAIERFLLAQS